MPRSPDYMSLVQRVERIRRRRWLILTLIAAVLIVFGVSIYKRFTPANRPVAYLNDEDHFKYGSIGSETDSGLPVMVWKALPILYPDVFKGSDLSVFGFLYENGPDGARRELPIGMSRRKIRGIELAWLNCAVCHTGTARDNSGGPTRVVAGMPSNNLDFHRFVAFVLGLAGDPKWKRRR